MSEDFLFLLSIGLGSIAAIIGSLTSTSSSITVSKRPSGDFPVSFLAPHVCVKQEDFMSLMIMRGKVNFSRRQDHHFHNKNYDLALTERVKAFWSESHKNIKTTIFVRNKNVWTEYRVSDDKWYPAMGHPMELSSFYPVFEEAFKDGERRKKIREEQEQARIEREAIEAARSKVW